jgi:hypothetical protein
MEMEWNGLSNAHSPFKDDRKLANTKGGGRRELFSKKGDGNGSEKATKDKEEGKGRNVAGRQMAKGIWGEGERADAVFGTFFCAPLKMCQSGGSDKNTIAAGGQFRRKNRRLLSPSASAGVPMVLWPSDFLFPPCLFYGTAKIRER